MKEKEKILLPTERSGLIEKSEVEPLPNIYGVQTYMWITENTFTELANPRAGLLEYILSPSNLNLAYRRVVSNKGGCGIDKMEYQELLPYLLEHKEALIDSIYNGKYRPNPVRRVEIPKSNGKVRLLGIPTLVDRLLQQAISQILEPLFDREFSSASYGFRTGRGAHQALRKCRDYLTENRMYVLDMDLENFFDCVNHSKLIELLSRRIKDGRVVSLIHKYLNAGIMKDEKTVRTYIGVPQGGPLSPLLSNILLNELDKELDRRGHKYVRYADDILIFCKSRRSASRCLQSLIPFIEKRLYLRVNRDKTKVSFYREITFLSYSFGRRKGEIRLGVSESAIKKLKQKIRELTRRKNGWGYDYLKFRLNQYIRGWLSYFRYSDSKKRLLRIDEWLRRRIRSYVWHRWRKRKTRWKNLRRLLTDKRKAYYESYSKKGSWPMSGSKAMSEALSNDRLRRAGYLFFSDNYRAQNL